MQSIANYLEVISNVVPKICARTNSAMVEDMKPRADGEELWTLRGGEACQDVVVDVACRGGAFVPARGARCGIGGGNSAG